MPASSRVIHSMISRCSRSAPLASSSETASPHCARRYRRGPTFTLRGKLERAASSKAFGMLACCPAVVWLRPGREAMPSNFIVLSHREPYAEVETEEGTVLKRKTNGVFATLDAVMQEQRGTWI